MAINPQEYLNKKLTEYLLFTKRSEAEVAEFIHKYRYNPLVVNYIHSNVGYYAIEKALKKSSILTLKFLESGQLIDEFQKKGGELSNQPGYPWKEILQAHILDLKFVENVLDLKHRYMGPIKALIADLLHDLMEKRKAKVDIGKEKSGKPREASPGFSGARDYNKFYPKNRDPRDTPYGATPRNPDKSKNPDKESSEFEYRNAFPKNPYDPYGTTPKNPIPDFAKNPAEPSDFKPRAESAAGGAHHRRDTSKNPIDPREAAQRTHLGPARGPASASEAGAGVYVPPKATFAYQEMMGREDDQDTKMFLDGLDAKRDKREQEKKLEIENIIMQYVKDGVDIYKPFGTKEQVEAFKPAEFKRKFHQIVSAGEIDKELITNAKAILENPAYKANYDKAKEALKDKAKKAKP